LIPLTLNLIWLNPILKNLPENKSKTPQVVHYLPTSPCELNSNSQNGRASAGFNNDPYKLPVGRAARVLVIPLSFIDYPASISDELKFKTFTAAASTYYRSMSNGSVTFNWEIQAKPLIINQAAVNLNLGSRDTPDLNADISTFLSAENQQFPNVNYSDYDLIVFYVPSTATITIFSTSESLLFNSQSADQGLNGVIYNVIFFASDAWSIDNPWQYLVHELGHGFDLPDNYATNATTTPYSQFEYMGFFDVMNYADGGAIAMSGWNRYQAGFISNSNIQCVNTPSETINLTPIETLPERFGKSLALIPLDNERAIAIEERVATGFDKPLLDIGSSSGVLIYLIDTSIKSGAGSSRILSTVPGALLNHKVVPAGSNTGINLFSHELLEKGDLISYGHVSIKILNSDSTGASVQVKVG
jgi:M6 family metalloprotease-like protein